MGPIALEGPRLEKRGPSSNDYFRRLRGVCDSALAAAVFDAVLVRPSRRTELAALAALALVCLRLGIKGSFARWFLGGATSRPAEWRRRTVSSGSS